MLGEEKTMRGLFNKYLAPNDYGRLIQDDAERIISELVHKFADADLVDLEHILTGTVSGICGERRLRRAMAMRKEERNAKREPG